MAVSGDGSGSSPDAIVPEVVDRDPARLPAGSEMWEIGADGVERLVGVFNDGVWVRAGG